MCDPSEEGLPEIKANFDEAKTLRDLDARNLYLVLHYLPLVGKGPPRSKEQFYVSCFPLLSRKKIILFCAR